MVPEVIGLGWDVGGWLGRKQGAAAVAWSAERGIWWLGQPTAFRLGGAEDSALTPERLAAHVGLSLNGAERVIVGIDAPLGFSTAYVQLVAGGAGRLHRPSRDIDDRLAFRESERFVHATFAKKPMSAPHNMLGANATVAISHARAWRDLGYAMLPFDGTHADRACIEVYPALEKRGGLLDERWTRLGLCIPQSAKPGSDAFDASICALIALAFGTHGEAGLPRGCGPTDAYADVARREGWIYTRCPEVAPANAIEPGEMET